MTPISSAGATEVATMLAGTMRTIHSVDIPKRRFFGIQENG
jgi:hypothetical protein